MFFLRHFSRDGGGAGRGRRRLWRRCRSFPTFLFYLSSCASSRVPSTCGRPASSSWRGREGGDAWAEAGRGSCDDKRRRGYEVACPVSCERRQCDRKTEARQRGQRAAMPASCGRRPARSSWCDGERRQVRAGEPRAEVAWSNSGGRRAAASFRRVFVVAGRHGWLMVYGLPLGA
ncbi:hypothetical protein PVAP13_9NG578828 [Panicum virgatum]|uniref:Uncharacterized protein n=1 Tax=Panicum virgatum TaxID=38727 RepID=A0A8T0N0V4_PANVG|nr:hypothetical protein PVAP13_9NG578828 [Panicum virgatum]